MEGNYSFYVSFLDFFPKSFPQNREENKNFIALAIKFLFFVVLLNRIFCRAIKENIPHNNCNEASNSQENVHRGPETEDKKIVEQRRNRRDNEYPRFISFFI